MKVSISDILGFRNGHVYAMGDDDRIYQSDPCEAEGAALDFSLKVDRKLWGFHCLQRATLAPFAYHWKLAEFSVDPFLFEQDLRWEAKVEYAFPHGVREQGFR